MEIDSIKYLIPERITRYKAALQGNEARQTSRIVDEIRHEFMADHAHMIFQERQAEWKKFLNEFYQAYGNSNELLMADRAQRQVRRESRHTETKIKQKQLVAEKERTEVFRSMRDEELDSGKIAHAQNIIKEADSNEAEDIRYRQQSADALEQERQSIISQAQADGIHLKAPNGQDTQLTSEQWVTVRTDAFKKWFGDWEFNPTEASKVIDANGEPLVVYHQTNAKVYINRTTGENWDQLDGWARYEWENRNDWEDYWKESDFHTFSRIKARQSIEIPAFFFSPEYDQFHEYGNRTVEAFLNIRRPAVNPHIKDAGVTSTAGLDTMNNLIAEGYDGFICEEDGTIVEINAFHPNHIKSATDNNGNYSSTNDDIRFRIGDTERLRAGQQITFTRVNPTVTFNAIKRRLNKTEIDFDEDHARTGSKYLSFSKNGVDYTLRSANHTKSYVGARKETTGIELHSYADGEIEFVDIDLSESQMRADDVFALINEIDAMKDSKKTFRDYVALRERPSQSLGDTFFTQALDETVHNILVRERNRLWDETFKQILTERPLENFTASNGFIVKDKVSWMTVDSPKGWQGKTKQHAAVAKAEYLQSSIYSGNKEAYEAASKAADRTTEDINRALQHWTEGDLRFRAAYHGSPHDFDRFDHSFMGTGEGNQAFGWGTYVTEVNGVAKRYAVKLTPRVIQYGGEALSDVLDNEYYFDDAWRIWKRYILSAVDKEELKKKITGVYIDGRAAGPRSKRRKEFERQKRELLDDIDSGQITIKSDPRNLYTVEIPDDTGTNYLRWDGRADRIIDQAGISEEEYEAVDMATGGDVYRYLADKLGSDRSASEYLSRAGFAGISYSAQYTTGGRSDEAKNYVIFNDQDVQITDHVRLRNAKMNVATLQIRRNEAEINANEKMEAVKELSAKLKLDVRIFWDLSSIPPEIPTDRRNSELRGWYNAPDGSISIVLSTHTSIADIQRTILHEGVAHKGLDDLLGREKANQLYERIFDSLPLIEKEKLRHQYTYKADAGAEYVAKLAEDNIQPNMVELILAIIRDFFREVLQISLKLSDMDIKALLYHSREQLSQRSSIKSKSACTSALDKLRKEVRENGRSAHLSKQQMVRKIH